LKGCESGINGQAGLSFCASNVHVLSLCQAPVPADSSASVNLAPPSFSTVDRKSKLQLKRIGKLAVIQLDEFMSIVRGE
ncbi:hypothetical protein, partial [Escherichia coli]|uniref:hypothetical protein n=1 Tax=Escherichia coli TaxID=562 RepID=UPI00289E2D4C